MRGFGCQAEPREAFRPSGWLCHGRNLTTLLFEQGVPCVLPDPMVPDAMQEPWASCYRPEPFRGGDHLHLVAPDVWLHA